MKPRFISFIATVIQHAINASRLIFLAQWENHNSTSVIQPEIATAYPASGIYYNMGIVKFSTNKSSFGVFVSKR